MFNGKMKALTLSYDDGVTQDRQLLRILEKYSLPCTFNLNSGCFAEAHAFYDKEKNRTFPHVRLRSTEIAEVYAGHEVAVHTVSHPALKDLSDDEILREVEDDRKALSELVGYDVVGMAYPGGTHVMNEHVADLIRTRTGIRYARTTTSTHSFDLQEDPTIFNPTVYHHVEWDALFDLGERFVGMKPDRPQIYYIWGHAYEFEANHNFDRFEQLGDRLAGREDIWYATNIEIYDYCQAFSQLIFNTAMTVCINPTAQDLWFANGKKEVHVPAGQTISF